jgi:hypothetical protein
MPRNLAERPTAPLPIVGAVGGDVVAYSLPETTLTGLRKFDLGNVPASVTPPRSWRKAAWFAVGTSTAVMTGLAAAAVAFMGSPEPTSTVIDALPAYPTKQIEIEELPADASSSAAQESSKRNSTTPTDAKPDTVVRPDDPSTTGTSAPGSSGGGTTTGEDTTTGPPPPPVRETVGEAPVTPTNPQEMGNRTEAFYAMVTENPEAAHEMTTGGMRAEGAEGIEARYAGVERVEVQHITIDRSQAVTTSTVRIVRSDGTESVETRRLTFTWGGDPKITDEAGG